ncbi:MAG: hypothetical protein KGH65_04765 [Candidatus Micrarchaeota archaeon]|nr:hypothetical protein [Candidatus Micrarchaeota archaeon]
MPKLTTAIFLLRCNDSCHGGDEKLSQALERRNGVVETSRVPGLMVKDKEYCMMVRTVGTQSQVDRLEYSLKKRDDLKKVARLTAKRE